MGQRRLRMTPWIAVLILGMIVSDRSGVCALTVAAALLHEMGHLTAARMLRIPLGQLRLNLLGARLEVRGRMLTYGEEWILCAFGPLFSLLGAAVGALFGRRGSECAFFPVHLCFWGFSIFCRSAPLMGEECWIALSRSGCPLCLHTAFCAWRPSSFCACFGCLPPIFYCARGRDFLSSAFP